MTARFVTPVYDGRTVTVSGTWDGDDARRSPSPTATRRAPRAGPARVPPATDRPAPPAAPLPAERHRRPSPDVAAARHRARLDRRGASTPPHHAAYLADVRETLPLYAAEGIAHPGWLLRFANSALVAQRRARPVDPRLVGRSPCSACVHDGETVEARAVVLDEFERKGHRFVTLDVAIAPTTARSSASPTPRSTNPAASTD